jgi:hypothetical protein
MALAMHFISYGLFWCASLAVTEEEEKGQR